MNSDFHVSVIIPVYNAEKFVKRAIDSVLIQQEVSELLLIEDGSTDSSLHICLKAAEFDKRIIVLQHQSCKNKGVSASRNMGIKNANCDYIAFLDADDFYLPNRFNKSLSILRGDKSVDGVYEMIGIYSNEAETKGFSKIERVHPDELFENLQPLGTKVWFHIDGLTVKKSIFDKCEFFDTSLKTSEDTLQWFKMACTSKLLSGSVQHPVALCERLATGLSANQAAVKKDFILMLFKLFEFCKKTGCKYSRRELALKSLFFYISNFPYNQSFKGISKLKFYLNIIMVDPTYVLLKSRVFKRYGGNLIRYNQIRYFLINK